MISVYQEMDSQAEGGRNSDVRALNHASLLATCSPVRSLKTRVHKDGASAAELCSRSTLRALVLELGFLRVFKDRSTRHLCTFDSASVDESSRPRGDTEAISSIIHRIPNAQLFGCTIIADQPNLYHSLNDVLRRLVFVSNLRALRV